MQTKRLSKKDMHVREIEPHVNLFRDPRNGIAWIENGRTGTSHSCHPSIDRTGNLTGMRKNGGWGNATVVQSHGFKYNVDSFVINKEDPFDLLVAQECQCSGCEKRRKEEKPADVWGYSYNQDGYQITFNGKNVGGAGVMLPRRKPLRGRQAEINRADFKRQAERAVEECRRRHAERKFNPDTHGNIWRWSKGN
jgi:hypothetical protein